ncbi:MAG: hypothetical protein WBF58_01510, partial [Xanthobacteraceae bacterium]
QNAAGAAAGKTARKAGKQGQSGRGCYAPIREANTHVPKIDHPQPQLRHPQISRTEPQTKAIWRHCGKQFLLGTGLVKRI